MTSSSRPGLMWRVRFLRQSTAQQKWRKCGYSPKIGHHWNQRSGHFWGWNLESSRQFRYFLIFILSCWLESLSNLRAQRVPVRAVGGANGKETPVLECHLTTKSMSLSPWNSPRLRVPILFDPGKFTKSQAAARPRFRPTSCRLKDRSLLLVTKEVLELCASLPAYLLIKTILNPIWS